MCPCPCPCPCPSFATTGSAAGELPGGEEAQSAEATDETRERAEHRRPPHEQAVGWQCPGRRGGAHAEHEPDRDQARAGLLRRRDAAPLGRLHAQHHRRLVGAQRRRSPIGLFAHASERGPPASPTPNGRLRGLRHGRSRRRSVMRCIVWTCRPSAARVWNASVIVREPSASTRRSPSASSGALVSHPGNVR
jgi:hypothetical protein